MWISLGIESTSMLLLDSETSSNNAIQAGSWVTTPPLITNINHIIATPTNENNPEVNITWTTNENSTGNVEYSTSLGGPYTLAALEDITADNTSHEKIIDGLLSDTNYYYIVRSKDSFGNESVSAEQTFKTNHVRLSDPPAVNNIVLNEFLPNPKGDDTAVSPDGEWVEIFNRGDVFVSLENWYLNDSDPTHVLPITVNNSIVSGPLSSGLNLAPQEFLVVYRNGDSDFTLNNDSGGDQINLYDQLGNLIDQQNYNSGLEDVVLENKSFARFPDGYDTWYDPIPTPGRINILESLPMTKIDNLPIPATVLPTQTEEPKIVLNLSDDKKSVSFTITFPDKFKELSYELTYMAYNVDKGIIGTGIDISSTDKYDKTVDLATCSSNICTYDENVHNVGIKIKLTDTDAKEFLIEKKL